jgi:hypothetical protein
LNQKSLSGGLNTYFDKIFLERSTLFKIRIIGIFIFIIGFIFFLNSIIFFLNSNVLIYIHYRLGLISFLNSFFLGSNIAVTFILIGIFIVFLSSKKNINDTSKDVYVIGFIIIWIILIFFITIHLNLEILFILSFLGILVINEITNKISSDSLKLRLNIFVFLFFFIFIIIVITKIINY